VVPKILSWTIEPFLRECKISTHYSIYGSLNVTKKCFGQRLPIPPHSTATRRGGSNRR